MRILIIRHGEPDYEHDSLTEKGWREAELLSEKLIHEQIDDFYVSPRGRAQATAAATLRRYSAQAETLPWLEEFRARIIDPASGEKRIPWDLMPQYWANSPAMSDPEHWTEDPLFLSGPVKQVADETVTGLESLLGRYGFTRNGRIWHCENNNEKTIALFCHFGIGCVIIGTFIGVSPALLWHSTLMAPTAVTEFVTEERLHGQVIFRMSRYGDVSHLYAAGEPVSPAGRFPETNDTDRALPVIDYKRYQYPKRG